MSSEHRCIFCGEISIAGIRLRGNLICSNCEKKLVRTEVDDMEYQNYKEAIRVIWDNSNISVR